MPPQNSPNRLDGDTDLETQRSPRLTTSTRLPIIRTSTDNDHQNRSWRALLERVIDRVPEPPGDSTTVLDNQAAREESRRLMEARLADRTYQSTTMSTYRGWAPGTIELERPLRSTPSRTLPRLDQVSGNTATRRYRREQRMYSTARTENGHRIDERRESSVPRWQPIQSSISRTSPPMASDSNPQRAAVLLESVRRQARVEMLRERMNSFTDARGDERYLEQFDDYNEPVDDAELLRTSNQNQAFAEAGQASLLGEENTTKVFEEAIILLDRLRMCLTLLDRSTLLEDAGFGMVNRTEMMANERTLDTRSVLKPQPSSWLRPGASFSGHQKASVMTGPVRLNRRSRRRQDETTMDQSMMPASEMSRPWAHGIVSAGSPDSVKDCWPVKVTITSVDYNNMTMTGTMEAFNVPNTKGTNLVPRDPNVSSITTYLEGEIIDLHKHSLRTTNFTAGSAVDATYWRRLEPFKSLEVCQIVEGFTDMEWLSKNLAQHWIIMRWKEKCFISPSDSNSGLTISGFYYITLKRSDGRIEGLYHDPPPCPYHDPPSCQYQHLSLMPEKPVFPVYAFR